MGELNIFESIGRTVHRIEPFHSQFFADTLCASFKKDASFFEAVWKLLAPSHWGVPECPRIKTEERDAGSGRRIDITIKDEAGCRVMGIEVKTSDSSAESGQLEKYQQDLRNNNKGSETAIVYLTPFNKQPGGDKPVELKSVKVFREFRGENAKHVSWLDVADIPWDGNLLWKQHQTYVRERISAPQTMESIVHRNRSFDEFFGEASAGHFWEALAAMGVQHTDNGAAIDLEKFEGDPRSLVRAFEILIEDGEDLSGRAVKKSEFPEDLRRDFVRSPFGEYHEALFELSRRFKHVGLRGEKDYGLVVAHKRATKGVSLVRSQGPQHFTGIGKPR